MKEQIQPNVNPSNRSIQLEEYEKNKLKQEIEKIFDTYKDKEERFTSVLSKIQILIEKGILDEKIIPELREYSGIENKNEFVDKMLVLLEPVLKIKVSNPRLIEKIQSDAGHEKENFIKLNEVLSYGISGDGKSVHIHLASLRELIREIGQDNLLNLVSDGLKELARIFEKDSNLLKVTATSMVITNNPQRMSTLGFVIKGPISKEDREKHWKGDERDIGVAEMSRDVLLNYLKK